MWGRFLDPSLRSGVPACHYEVTNAALRNEAKPVELRSAARTWASGPTCVKRNLLTVFSTAAKHVQDSEVHDCTDMMSRARLIGIAVCVNPDPLTEVKSLF